MPAFLRRCLAVTLAALVCAAPAWSQGKIDLAVFHPEKNFWTPTLTWWIGEVEKATQGRVKFVPHFAGALVPVNETLKAVRDGSVPAGVISAAAVSGQMPSVAYLEAIGGMPANVGAFVEAVNALRPVLEAEYRKQGAEYLWSQGSGGLIVVCRDRHLKTPADWKNRKVRTAGRWQAEQLRTMGVSPVATDPSEQYIALQNRTIDCALSVNVLASALKLHEVAPRVTQLRMPVNLSSYIINKPIYDKISAEDRAAMRKLSIEGDKRSAEHLAKVEADAIAQMKSQKADIYSLTDQELKALRDGIAASFAKMDAEGGETGKQIGSILKKYW
jgi:TRAP-type C4-dicarboxylate transport system substrate-binding protein